jgi:putative thioredoxin
MDRVMDPKQPSSDQIFEAGPENFQTAVLDRSRQAPVILLFWAPEVIPSAEVRRDLEKLARGYTGKVFLALVDVSRDPTLAQHLRVQGLPSIRVVQGGQLVHQMEGPQPESTLRALLDQLTLSSAEILKEDLAGLLEAGQYDRALAMLQQAIAEEPQNQAFQVELADVLARSGKLEEARQVVAGIVEGADERDRPQARIELLEEAAQLEPLVKLEESLARDPDDLQARYGIAVHAAAAGDYARALDESLAILRADRSFRDDLGRLTMIRLFKIMGKGSALASQYRRQMFNFMH